MEPGFRQLPGAKRRKILDAALEEFAAHEYKAANTDTIAARAGISKGLLFYYFKNKKALYLTLLKYMANTIEREIKFDPPETKVDFFDWLEQLSAQKIPALKKMPGLLAFSMKAYYHPAGELSGVVNHYMVTMSEKMYAKYLANADESKFRPEYTPRQAMDLLIYLTDGYLHTKMMAGEELDLDALFAEYLKWQEMVRRTVYKEEFL